MSWGKYRCPPLIFAKIFCFAFYLQTKVRTKMAISPLKKVVFLISVGLLSTAIGVTFYVLFPSLLKSEMKKRLVLSEGSMAYDFWKDIPIPIYLRLYLFNIANPMDVYQNLSKPILEERGPYTFSETRQKVNITWHDNGTVSYRQIKSWHFRQDLTNGSLDDVITTLNVPMLAVAAKAKRANSMFVNLGVNVLFEVMGSTWFVRKTIRELLFEGYNDPILDEAQKYITLRQDKFGWMYGRNNSDEGMFTIFSGVNGFDKYAEVDTYKGLHTFDFMEPPCRQVRGSAGDVFPPFSRPEKLFLFLGDACRTMCITYLGDGTYKGLETRRYYGDQATLDNGQYNESNKCYCVNGNCLPPGGIDISACQDGIPVVTSFPHFLFADSSYGEKVEGLHPDPKKHLTYLDLEKNSGLPIGGNANMQVNVVFERNPSLMQFENLTETIYFPAMWASQTADFPDDMLSLLKLVLYTVPLIVQVICFFLVGLGASLVIAALILTAYYTSGKGRPNYQPVGVKPIDCKDFGYTDCANPKKELTDNCKGVNKL